MSLKLILSVFLLIPTVIICKTTPEINKNPSVDEKWVSAFNEIGGLVKQFSDKLLPSFDRVISEVNISSKCSNSLRKLLTDTDEEWVAMSKL